MRFRQRRHALNLGRGSPSAHREITEREWKSFHFHLLFLGKLRRVIYFIVEFFCLFLGGAVCLFCLSLTAPIQRKPPKEAF